MVADVILYQGDSSDTIVADVYSSDVQVTSLISNGYTGTLTVHTALGTTPLVNKTMTEVDNSFTATLLSTDTASLSVGSYKGIVQIENSALSYKRESHFKIIVKSQGYIE